MSGGTRVPLAEAEIVAQQLAGLLGLGCERIEVAGSIRRRKHDVGDIELVAVPRMHTETFREGLFENREVVIDELQVVIDTLLMDGTLSHHPDDPKRGPRYSKFVHTDSGMQVDIFSATAETFGLMFLIRTGPASYSQWVVTEAKKRVHHVADGQLHHGSLGCGSIPCTLIPTPEEAHVYRALSIMYLPPERRG